MLNMTIEHLPLFPLMVLVIMEEVREVRPASVMRDLLIDTQYRIHLIMEYRDATKDVVHLHRPQEALKKEDDDVIRSMEDDQGNTNEVIITDIEKVLEREGGQEVLDIDDGRQLIHKHGIINFTI